MLEIEMISLLSINFSNKCIGHFIITILYYMTCIEEKHKTRQKIVYIFVGYIEKDVHTLKFHAFRQLFLQPKQIYATAKYLLAYYFSRVWSLQKVMSKLLYMIGMYPYFSIPFL